MKSIVAFSLISVSSLAQTKVDSGALPVDNATGAVQFRQVIVTNPPEDPREGMRRALSWVSSVYRSADDVVQQYDPQAGRLIVQGQLPIINTDTYSFIGKQAALVRIKVYHTLSIEVKSDQYQATLSNFEQESGGVRAPLEANLGTMTREDYLERVRRYAAGTSQEKNVIKAAQKNAGQVLAENRRYAVELKQQCLSILDGLKQHMQKKAGKDW